MGSRATLTATDSSGGTDRSVAPEMVAGSGLVKMKRAARNASVALPDALHTAQQPGMVHASGPVGVKDLLFCRGLADQAESLPWQLDPVQGVGLIPFVSRFPLLRPSGRPVYFDRYPEPVGNDIADCREDVVFRPRRVKEDTAIRFGTGDAMKGLPSCLLNRQIVTLEPVCALVAGAGASETLSHRNIKDECEIGQCPSRRDGLQFADPVFGNTR